MPKREYVDLVGGVSSRQVFVELVLGWVLEQDKVKDRVVRLVVHRGAELNAAAGANKKRDSKIFKKMLF